MMKLHGAFPAWKICQPIHGTTRRVSIRNAVCAPISRIGVRALPRASARSAPIAEAASVVQGPRRHRGRRDRELETWAFLVGAGLNPKESWLFDRNPHPGCRLRAPRERYTSNKKMEVGVKGPRLPRFAFSASAPGAGSRPIVGKWFVTFTYRLTKTRLLRAPHEIETLLSVPRNSIEKRSQQARSRKAHLLRGVVAQQFQHLELVEWYPCHPFRKPGRMFEKLSLGHGFK